MASLTIKNIGPVVGVKLELSSVNVLMGPQGCGKSTIAKIISFCCWLEKDCLIRMSTEHVDNDYVNAHLIEFYRMKSYFWRDSYICYEGRSVNFLYEKGNVTVARTERFLSSAVGKVSYLPAERNVILLPNIGQIPMDMDYLRSYIFDWLALRGRFDGESAIGLLDMDAEYYYDDNQKRDVVRLNGRNNIMLTEASSGIQSVTPLYASVKYLTEVIYSKKESISFDRQRLIDSSVASVQAEVIDSIGKEQKAQDPAGEGLGLYNIIDGSEIDTRLEAIKDNISRTHFANIIMEEPELSIFPQSQVAMVRDFLKMLDTERDMLVFTTHSPYVLYALNNYMLGWLAKENMEEEGEGEEGLLAQADAFVNPKKVSVWEIKDGKFQPIEDSENGTIQDANGLIRGNYFDRVMKDVMGDFSAYLSYYE